MLALAGYDEHEIGYKPDREPLSLIDQATDIAPCFDPETDESCCTTSFSWNACHGCGSQLGGDRHHYQTV